MSTRVRVFFWTLLTAGSFALILFAALPLIYGVSEKANKFPSLEYQRQDGALQVNRTFHSVATADWLKLAEVPDHVWGSIVVSEDWAFFEHSGMDYRQLWRAVRDSLFRGDKLRGASTISQQLAKNLFLSHERSVGRKIFEVRLAAALESELSKEEILERYLNIVEWGPNVVGLKQAALYYFSKSVDRLSVVEAALLAQLLPSPIRYGKTLREGEITEYAQERVEWIRDAIQQAGFWGPPAAEVRVSEQLDQTTEEVGAGMVEQE